MNKSPQKKQLIRAASISPMFVAFLMLFLVNSRSQAQAQNTPFDAPEHAKPPQEYVKSIDDLMHDRLEEERAKFGDRLAPEYLKLEANYIRTDAPTGEIVMHEASFHLEPRYMTMNAAGVRITDSTNSSAQSVMYFSGSARTPLALPVVSNLSTLPGDAASYTVYIGILPLPKSLKDKSDSIHYYVILERAVESNKSEAEKIFERYAKEFTAKPGEPMRLHLENTPPEGDHYILKIEDNHTLNFYEDFASHFKEDILLNGEPLAFELHKADLAPLSSRLSIPYTIARACSVRLDLVSIVDPAHPLTLIDSVMQPADYLAEHDLKQFTNGTYQYRLVAKELGTDKVLFNETKSFEKKAPLTVERRYSLNGGSDTIEVGGKKENAQKLYQQLAIAKAIAETRNIQLAATLKSKESDNEELKKEVEAQKSNVIAGLKIRGGLGFGNSTGINLFIGAESAVPSFTLDLSYGWLYSTSVPYLRYDAPPNASQLFTSPKSLGLQLGYSPISFLHGIAQVVTRIGFYGIYSSESPTSQGGIHSATLFAPAIGLMTTPGGVGTSFGFDFTAGPIFGLGIAQPAQLDIQAKFYLRF